MPLEPSPFSPWMEKDCKGSSGPGLEVVHTPLTMFQGSELSHVATPNCSELGNVVQHYLLEGKDWKTGEHQQAGHTSFPPLFGTSGPFLFLSACVSG